MLWVASHRSQFPSVREEAVRRWMLAEVTGAPLAGGVHRRHGELWRIGEHLPQGAVGQLVGVQGHLKPKKLGSSQKHECRFWLQSLVAIEAKRLSRNCRVRAPFGREDVQPITILLHIALLADIRCFTSSQLRLYRFQAVPCHMCWQ